MIKKDELSNPNSCLNRAQDDEPLFVLRANDPIAPHVVKAWADQYLQGKALGGGAQLNHVQKYREAMDLATQMTLWKPAPPPPKEGGAE